MNIQTILDKLTDDLTHYTKVINTIPAYQGIQEFDKVWNGVKDSLTSMLDGIEKEAKELDCYTQTTLSSGKKVNLVSKEEVINIINSHH